MGKKKGISPLIATVLILGFTVALAAVIMVWGQKFTTGIQKQTEETANTQMRCATDVDFRIKNVCWDAANSVYSVTVENNQALRINQLVVRFYQTANTVQTANMFATGIDGYGVASQGSTGIAGNVKLVEALPVVTFEGRQITCAANKQDFGDLDSAAIAACV